MRIRICEAALQLTDCSTRIPFRFGISTLTNAPLALLRLVVETETGERATGCASDLLVPKWFEKDPGKTPEDDVAALERSIEAAVGAAIAPDRAPATVFDHWWVLYDELVTNAAAGSGPSLVRGFGVALVERATIDAACRAAGRSFFDALRDDLFGFEPGRAVSDLAGWTARERLAAPSSAVDLRHTVGLLDALRDDDIAAGAHVDDGLPESLEDDLRTYGLRSLKIKLSGDRASDVARLLAIADVVAGASNEPPELTLDGNEQYDDVGTLVDLLDELRRTERGARFIGGLISIEQPLSRGITFEREPHRAMNALDAYAPVIIDEADDSIDAFPRAVELGYRGISVKNCKGVFRALINRGRCDLSGGRLFQSAEDLTNLPVVALQQDLATVAALGLRHVERNGHHYFRGLDHLAPAVADAALAAHPDLYTRDEHGVVLRIERGCLQLGSLQQVGYGYHLPLDREP